MDRRRLAYMPGLDGLRGLAVAAVVLYHAEPRWLPGGFLGVDVFFVISGYLITSLLLAEHAQRGNIDLPGFWMRRARRLLPALFALLLGVLGFALVVTPGDVARLRIDSLAASGYVSNWYLIFRHQPYFETLGRPSLFQHLWSLAVEEQFYLVWPPLLAVALRVMRRRWSFALVLAGIAGSTLLMAAMYAPGADTSRIYYGTDTRAAELLVGAALAFVWAPGAAARWTSGPRGLLLDAAGLAGVVAAATAACVLEGDAPLIYRGGLTLFAGITAVVIVSAVRPGSMLSRLLLAVPPLPWIGLRSYSIYLWHWPVFMMTRAEDVGFDGPGLLALRVGLTLALAEVSYTLVETPVRNGALGRAWGMLHGRSSTPRFVLGRTAAYGGSALVVSVGVLVACARPVAPPAYLTLPPVNTVHAVAAPSGTPDDGADRWASSAPHAVVEARKPAASVVTGRGAVPSPVPSVGPARDGSTYSAAALRRAPSITAIGDSVMLGAVPALQRQMPQIQIDAAVGRQVSTALELVQKLRDANELGDVVVLHLGNNGTFTSGQFDALMRVIGEQRQAIFIAVKEARSWEAENDRVLAQGVQRYPNARLIDWYTLSAGHPIYFWDDGIHLRPEGADAYAELVRWYVALSLQ